MTNNRNTLKGYFNAGDRPKESEFADLIDSTLNLEEDKANDTDIDAGTSNDKFVTVKGSKRSARKSITVNGVSADLNTGNIQLPDSEVPLTFGTGLTRISDIVTVNPSQEITKISNLTANGYIKTNSGNGTLSVEATIPSSDLSGTSLPTTITSSNLTSFGVNPNIGQAQGTSLTVSGSVLSSGGGIGYTTGNGGVVTQLTSKSTALTLNKLAGNITLHNAALAAGAIVSFTLNNSQIGPNDVIYLQHQAVGTFGAYTLNGRTAAGSAIISIRNNSSSSLSEGIVLRFIVIKSTIA